MEEQRPRAPMEQAEAAAPGPGAAERTLTHRFVRVRRARFDRLEVAPAGAPAPPGLRYSHLARLLALAHALEKRISSGEVEGRQALSRALGLSPPRLGQLLDLALLAPDLQLEILAAAPDSPIGRLSQRAVLRVALTPSWPEQRRRWAEMTGSSS